MYCSQNDVLNIKDLRVCYPGSKKWVINGLNLRISRGERLALIGSSGSGKSTVAKALLQLSPPGSLCRGQLFVNGRNVMRLSNLELEKLRGEMIGLVFQDPGSRLNPLMTIGSHLIDTLQSHYPKKPASWIQFRAEELLDKVGINPLRFNSYPHEFSGGMRQRVAIALAIALNPLLIIADEPTSSLDVTIANKIMEELNLLCNEMNSSLLLISHDLALASRWCEKMAIIDQGVIVEEQLSQDLLHMPKSSVGKKLVAAVKAREAFNSHGNIESKEILKVDRLRCWYPLAGLPWEQNWLKTLDEVSFTLNEGETLGVVGTSGCGKSTLCRALLGLIPIRGGEIILMGKNVANFNQKSITNFRCSVQMVFQDPFASLNPKMTVLEAVTDPLLIHNLASRGKANETAKCLLEKVGLIPIEDFQYRLPHQMSGGQQQRVAIARALALQPKILICDESVSMLDAEIQADILDLLKSLQSSLGIAIIFITHDLSVATSFCHKVIVLDQGKVVEEGVVTQILRNPKAFITRELVSASPRITSID